MGCYCCAIVPSKARFSMPRKKQVCPGGGGERPCAAAAGAALSVCVPPHCFVFTCCADLPMVLVSTKHHRCNLTLRRAHGARACVVRVPPMQQQDALKHLTAEQKWETVVTERAKTKGGGSRRGSTGGISEDNNEERNENIERSTDLGDWYARAREREGEM